MKISKAKNIKVIQLKNTKICCQIIGSTLMNSTIDYYRRVIADISASNQFGPAFDNIEIGLKRVELIMPFDKFNIVGAAIIEKKKNIIFTYDFISEDRNTIILDKEYWAIRSIQIIEKYQKKGIGTDIVEYIMEEKNNGELKYPLISTTMYNPGIQLLKRFGKIYRA